MHKYVIRYGVSACLLIVAWLLFGPATDPGPALPPSIIVHSPAELDAIITRATPPNQATVIRVEHAGPSGHGKRAREIHMRPPTDAERRSFDQRARDVVNTVQRARMRHPPGSPADLRLLFQQLRYEAALDHQESMFVSRNLGAFISNKEFYYFGMIIPHRGGQEGGVDVYVKIPLKEHPELSLAIDNHQQVNSFMEMEEYGKWISIPELERVALVDRAREAVRVLRTIEREYRELQGIDQADPRWSRREELRIARDAALQQNAAIPNAVDRDTGVWKFRYQ